MFLIMDTPDKASDGDAGLNPTPLHWDIHSCVRLKVHMRTMGARDLETSALAEL